MPHSESSLCFGRHDPCFQGHFEGNPVVPAVVILGEVCSCVERQLGRRVKRVARARFQAPLRPDVRWQVNVVVGEEDEVRIACTSDGQTMMNAKLLLEPD